MSEFKNGQRVKVEFEGVIGDHPIRVKGHDVAVVRPNGFTHLVQPEDVTLLDPAGWPPQVGDIWATKDGFGPVGEWFCQSSRMHGFVMRSEDTSNTRVVLDEFKALNPVLVRRRGQ